MDRRTFLRSAGLALSGLAFRTRPAAALVRREGAPVLDALGEVRLDYPPSLLEEILAGGTTAVHVTLGNPALQGPEAYEASLAEVAAYEAHLERHRDRLLRVTRVADVDRAQRERRLGILYGFQNAAPIGDRLDRLDFFHGLGVRCVQLTYDARNLLGDGCRERTNAGLSHLGLAVVERLNDLGMLVDLSHCGPATALDAIRRSRKPVAFTHAGCRAVYDHPRNRTDEELRALAERGGVLGVYQIAPFLSGKERSTVEDYLDHVDHAVQVAGVDHVGVGSDREHRVIPDTAEEKRKLEEELARLRPSPERTFRWPYFVAELNHPRRMETVRRGLERRGYGAEAIEKILGRNVYRVWREAIG